MGSYKHVKKKKRQSDGVFSFFCNSSVCGAAAGVFFLLPQGIKLHTTDLLSPHRQTPNSGTSVTHARNENITIISTVSFANSEVTQSSSEGRWAGAGPHKDSFVCTDLDIFA